MFAQLLFSALVLSLLVAPAATTSSASSPTPPSFVSAWDAFVHEQISSAPHGLQQDCVPRRFPSTAPNSTYKGVAVLFHGFSACPQQYFQLAPRLAAEGYDVLLPLTPGHGNNYSFHTNGTCIPFLPPGCNGTLDDITHLPTETKVRMPVARSRLDCMCPAIRNTQYECGVTQFSGSCKILLVHTDELRGKPSRFRHPTQEKHERLTSATSFSPTPSCPASPFYPQTTSSPTMVPPQRHSPPQGLQ